MSLLVWYPLQGNTKNYGTLGAALDPTESSVVYTTGILGQSKSTGSLSWTAEQTSKVFHKTTSIAFWIKPTAAGSGCIVGNDDMGATTGRRKYCFYQWQTYDSLHYTWQHDDSGSAFFGGTTPITPNQWNHVVGIQSEEGYCAIYVNGELRVKEYHDIKNMNFNYSWPTPIIRNTSINNMCDFRVYDHALSLKEIKELAKGLVLHYTFDSPSFEGTTNLFKDWDTNFSSVAVGAYSAVSNQLGSGSAIEVVDFLTYGRVLKITGGSGSSNRCYRALSVSGDKTYTFSFEIYSDSTSGVYAHIEANGGDYGSGWPTMGTVYYTTPGKWQTLHITFTPQTNPTLYFFWHVNAGNCIYIRNFQLEEKDHPTPYASNTRACVIGDCSGLGNDGTLVLPEYYSFTQDSILGTGALYSAGNSDGTAYIKTKLNPSFIAGTGTICFWYKKNTGSDGFLVATPDPGNQTHYLWANSPGGNPWNGGGASYSHWYIDGVQGKTPVSDTDWHFYCIAGVNISGWSSFAIQRHGDGAWLYRGKIADFRVYNTVLDSGEVQAMYKTHWAANKQAQVFSNAVNENQAKYQITRSGVVNCNELNETPILPHPYTPYQSADTNTAINTGIIPNQNTYIDIIFTPNSYASNQAFIYGGGGSDYQTRAYELYTWSGHFQFNYNNSTVNIDPLASAPTMTRVVQNKNNIRITQNNTTVTATLTASNFTADVPLTFGAINRTTGTILSQSQVFFHRIIIRNGTQLQRYYVPCFNGSQSGFYDFVTGSFTGNGEASCVSGNAPEDNMGVNSIGSVFCSELNEI